MTPDRSPLRVLVVDDELLLRWALCEVLQRHGHTVLEATSAATTLSAISDAADQIDVVLLDYRLPDSQSLELLQELRRRLPHAAVVLMIAYETPDVVQGALELGAYCVLVKPFDMHAVDMIVRNAHQRLRHQ